MKYLFIFLNFYLRNDVNVLIRIPHVNQFCSISRWKRSVPDGKSFSARRKIEESILFKSVTLNFPDTRLPWVYQSPIKSVSKHFSFLRLSHLLRTNWSVTSDCLFSNLFYNINVFNVFLIGSSQLQEKTIKVMKNTNSSDWNRKKRKKKQKINKMKMSLLWFVSNFMRIWKDQSVCYDERTTYLLL